MRCEERYAEIYGRDPEAVAFCPYRIAPLGAHIDHQNGSINGFAIDKGIQNYKSGEWVLAPGELEEAKIAVINGQGDCDTWEPVFE